MDGQDEDAPCSHWLGELPQQSVSASGLSPPFTIKVAGGVSHWKSVYPNPPVGISLSQFHCSNWK